MNISIHDVEEIQAKCIDTTEGMACIMLWVRYKDQPKVDLNGTISFHMPHLVAHKLTQAINQAQKPDAMERLAAEFQKEVDNPPAEVKPFMPKVVDKCDEHDFKHGATIEQTSLGQFAPTDPRHG